jgi:AraC family transcriptional regulator, arabinose operon regulatory protein
MSKEIVPEEYQSNISLQIPTEVLFQESSNSILKNMTVTRIGYFGAAKGHFVKREGVDEYILIYCIGGKGWIETGNQRKSVGNGDIVFCDINKPHSYGADNENPWSIHWVHFIGQGGYDFFSLLGISEYAPALHIGKKEEIISLFDRIHKTLSFSHSLANMLLASTYLQELFCNLLKLKIKAEQGNIYEVNMERLVEYMMSNVSNILSLEHFADYVNMSKYHFVRRFKETTGYSPIEYFNHLKIRKACDLLETSNLEIKEISDYLGINNPFYFTEMFKRTIGMAPSKYRKMQRST